MVTFDPNTKAANYFAKRNFTNLKDYQFDFSKNVLYVGNGTHIFNISINVTTNA